MKTRWLKTGTHHIKRHAQIMGLNAVRKNSKRIGYKLKKRGKYYDIYVLSTEKSL